MAATSDQHLHLVSFDIPYPANYGGAIDIFYKLTLFKEIGVKVHLHCYQYNRSPQPLLESLCETIAYYPRDLNWRHLFSSLPYIVSTRSSKVLLDALLGDNYPILFEGLHSCSSLDHPALSGRRMVVRTHNIEHEYYTSLGDVENNPLKRMYFRREAKKLSRYERIFCHASALAAISNKDNHCLSRRYPGVKVETVSAFHPFDKVEIMPGCGEYALYHGSLEVGENNKAAIYLIKAVFKDLDIPLKIAGNNPSRELLSAAAGHENIEIITNVTTEMIYKLVREAHVNVLPTFQATGIKLKLLAALFSGRHCLVNNPMVEKTGLEVLCHLADNSADMQHQLRKLFQEDFGNELIEKRKEILEHGMFSNISNIEKLSALMFGEVQATR